MSNLTHITKRKPKKPKILLIIDGGSGQVYADHAADVMVIDHDNLREGQDPGILDLWEKAERLSFKEMLTIITETKVEYAGCASGSNQIAAGGGT